jgi:hypothetical protein
MKYQSTALILLLATVLLFVGSVKAVTPKLYSCLAPSGTVIAKYDSGTHGIVGKYTTFEGSDIVYQEGSDALQCFCANDGGGIQTNWLNAGQFTSQEIDTYRRNGWIYVETGSAWGLSQDPYLAKNASYYCRNNGVTDPGDGALGYGTGGGADMLAATGSWSFVFYMAMTGATFMSGAFVISKSRTRNA